MYTNKSEININKHSQIFSAKLVAIPSPVE